jgi:hypothetical protein
VFLQINPDMPLRKKLNRLSRTCFQFVAQLLTILSVLTFFIPLASFASLKPVKITHQELSATVGQQVKIIPEFRFIKEEAEKLGVRVWLFGGTASSFLYYVKNDLRQKLGDRRLSPDRFDYDFTNIFRSTQDLDIVVDGDLSQIEILEQIIRRKYPQFLGEKNAKWELRSLRQNIGTAGKPGYKEALLQSFDFKNQHTDSNSVGMVELTDSTEPVVRDLHQWNKKTPRFLTDIADDKITYLWSPKHQQTSRYQAGQNPEIFSVIRALTKSFQYEAEFDSDSWDKMKKVINEWNPEAKMNKQTMQRLQELGKKLFVHAVDVEKAWNETQRIGLREKLLEAFPNSHEDISIWMSKEPLRSFPLGRGSGRTAKELGISVVAHETGDLIAYESITRAHSGYPNVFISRKGGIGETAAFGDGFYVAVGDVGAKDTGINIKFRLDPDAREGTDFLFVPKKNYLVIKNKNSLKVIYESFNLEPLQYFRMLYQGKLIDTRNIALVEKFKRSMALKLAAASPDQFKQIYGLVQRAIKNFGKGESIDSFLPDVDPPDRKVRRQPLPKDHFQNLSPQEVKRTGQARLIVDWMQLDQSLKSPEIIQNLLAANQDAFLAAYVLTTEKWAQPELLKTLVDRGVADIEAVQFGLSNRVLGSDIEVIQFLVAKQKYDRELLRSGLNFIDSKTSSEIINEIMMRNSKDKSFLYETLQFRKLTKNKSYVQYLIRLNDKNLERNLAWILSSKGWEQSPELVEDFVRNSESSEAVDQVLKSHVWRNHKDLHKLVRGINLSELNHFNLKAAFEMGRSLKDPASLEKGTKPSVSRSEIEKYQKLQFEIEMLSYEMKKKEPVFKKEKLSAFEQIQKYRFPETLSWLSELIIEEIGRHRSFTLPYELNYLEALLHSYLGLVDANLDTENQRRLSDVWDRLSYLGIVQILGDRTDVVPEYQYLQRAQKHLSELRMNRMVKPLDPPPILEKHMKKSCKVVVSKLPIQPN